MIDNQNAEQIEEEPVTIEITEDPVETSEPEDELESYTKSVSKRINKLNAKHREAEQRAQQLSKLRFRKKQSFSSTETTRFNNRIMCWPKKRKLWLRKKLRSMTCIRRPSNLATVT